MNRRLFIAAILPALLANLRADDPASSSLPGPGFNGDRYATLWTKSPFAIATPDAGTTSTDYQLVGMAQFDNVNYVSLIDKQSQEHFVLSSDKPVRNLTLVSISHGPDGASAVIQRNGETLTLRQEQAAAPAANPNAPPVAQVPDPQRPVQTPLSNVGGVTPVPHRPFARFHRPVIPVPPPPSQ